MDVIVFVDGGDCADTVGKKAVVDVRNGSAPECRNREMFGND
jgi:hypothetical protein